MGVTEAHAPAEDSLRSGGQSHSLGPGAEASSLPPPSLKGLSCAKNSTRPKSLPQLVAKKSLDVLCFFLHQNTVGSGGEGQDPLPQLAGPTAK